MQTKPIRRPWEKPSGHRINPDPFYQSPQWKYIRRTFRTGFTIVNGVNLSNTMCIDCFKESGLFVPGNNTDHIIARKDGGSDDHSNLQTLCDSHHAIKSANEGNQRRKK